MPAKRSPTVAFTCLFLALAPCSAFAQAVPEAEEIDIAELPAFADHWVLVMDAWGSGTRLVNGDDGEVLGTLHTIPLSNVALAPDRRHIYVAETIWTKGNRGVRQDMLTVYDARTFKLLSEIPLPGRLLTGNRRHNLDISPDGKFAYIYDLSPTSGILVVDLSKGQVDQTVELPGCALAFAGPANSIASLCGDGTVATLRVQSGRAAETKLSQPFFSPDDDPIFDNSVVDLPGGRIFFLTYSGMVYEKTFDGTAKPVGWSIQEAAGMNRGSTRPLDLSWLPGGRQLLAYHGSSQRLYVLMHPGEFWSHKEDGVEVWVLDVATRKLLKRHKLEEPVTYMAVSQDAEPLLFLAGEGTLTILDARSFEEKHHLDEIETGILTVANP